MQEDVFEYIQKKLGLEYISDMKFEPYNDMAKDEVKKLDLSNYDLSQLNDLADYLYHKSVPFKDKDEALKFFEYVS